MSLPTTPGTQAPPKGVGALVLRTLRAEGVDIGHAVTDDTGRPTGLLLTEPRLGTLTLVSYYRSGSAGSALSPARTPALAAGTRVLHLTGITPALGASAAEATLAAATAAREAGITVCLDVNHRSRLRTADRARTALRPLLARTDLLIASEDELPLVLECPGAQESEAVRSVLEEGVGEMVVKRGARGATAFTADERPTARPAGSTRSTWSAPATPSWPDTSPVSSTARTSPARQHRAVTTAGVRRRHPR